MSAKELNAPALSYKPEKPIVTPYQKAFQQWDDRIGSARVQAFNWRLTALAAITLNIILVLGLIYQGSRSEIIPYIVEVDALGAASAVNPVQAYNYNPSAASIEFFLSRFVNDVRAIPLDAVVLKKQWLNAYAFVTDNGNNQLTQFISKTQPFNNVGAILRTVEIVNILKMSNKTYQVEWKEIEYNKQGRRKSNQSFRGVFNIILATPSSAENLRQNPLGIYIDSYNWSKTIQ